jgi:hypothetical protein
VYCVELGEKLIDFLIEALQGPCKENQRCLSENKIVEFVQKFLLSFQNQHDYRTRGFFEKDQQKEIDELMILSMELLSNLLEANNDDNIYQFLVKLDIKIMRLKLLQEYITYVTTILELDVMASAN